MVTKEVCEHTEWEKREEYWEETPGTGPIMSKLPKWQYHATVKVCKHCGEKEILGGTVVVPETPGYYLAGEYELNPDGSRGLCIS